jgi:hypothetical protein
MFECAWRLDTFFVPLEDWLKPLFRGAVLDDKCWTDLSSRQSVGLLLLRTAREERNQSAFTEWIQYLQAHRDSDPEIADQVRYQRCLWARDELNFKELKDLLSDFSGSDPLGRFRRAAILCDLGDLKGAREAANNGLREIREYFYRDRESIWTISRLAWAQFLSRGLRSWTTMLHERDDEPVEESDLLRLRIFETKSDPWELLQAIDMKIEEDLRRVAERNKGKEPLFDPGSYRDHSMTVHLGNWWPTEALYEIWRMVDLLGVPPRGDHTIIMAARMERAELLTGYRYEEDSDFLRVLREAHAVGENLVKVVFSRIQIAVIADERRATLV